MTESKICTCPSGDGSLRWPCPAHPAVEQAGGDERAAFEDWVRRDWPAAPLHHVRDALPANNPRYGEYCNEMIQRAWVGWQARAALAQPSPTTDSRPAEWSSYDPTWVVDFIRDNSIFNADLIERMLEYATRPAGDVPQAEQAEAERPVVVARLYRSNDLTMTPFAEVQKPLPLPASDGTLTVDALMTVAQHERIVEARWNRAMDLMGEHVARISEKLKAERDAALVRVAELESKLAELEKQEPVALANRGNQGFWVEWTEAAAGLYGSGIKLYAATVAQSQHSVPEGYALIPVRETEAMHDAVMALLYKGVARIDTQKLLDAYIAAAPGKEGV
ncbi:hypothetical protein R0M21_005616 [Pseudomonas aeruginosa]|nr:hypothetical protein [Pseudomonas aeruginosa]